MEQPILLALDSGTSLVKAVAFSASGEVHAVASRPNVVAMLPGAGAEQDMRRSWDDAVAVLADVAGKVAGQRIIGLAVTGQGDGTWLVDRDGEPVGPAWLWLDARAAEMVAHLRESGAARAAFAYTGTGLNACQQSAQLLAMRRDRPDAVRASAHALHCKEWLYLKLTGMTVADVSEACFTWGDFRTRDYRAEVMEALGAQDLARLLPPVVDGTTIHHALSPAAAARTGLPAGLPVVLAYVDVVCTALGAGLYGATDDTGVSILGSTGMHLRLSPDPAHVAPSADMTGYCMPFPVPGHTMQAQTMMAATLNLDWLADLVGGSAGLLGAAPVERHVVLRALDRAVAQARPGAAIYHPFISSSGERGPFIDPHARASLLGFDGSAGLADLARSVYEGIGLAARDCYIALGGAPAEVRVTGGAARSQPMRAILAACLDRPVRSVAQAEAGAAGAAMIAAVCLGLYPDMKACAADWLGGSAGDIERPDADLARIYDVLFPIYRSGYAALPGLWRDLHRLREVAHEA